VLVNKSSEQNSLVSLARTGGTEILGRSTERSHAEGLGELSCKKK